MQIYLPRIFYAVLFFCLVSLGTTASANPWTTEGGIAPQQTIERLQEKYPEIKNARDLENILKELGRIQPVLALEANKKQGLWRISGKKAKLIGDVQIDSVTRFLRVPLLGLGRGYIGQVASNELKSKIESSLKSYLRKRGYPKAELKITESVTDAGLEYLVEVDEQEPCLIQSVETGFTLPEGVKTDLERGDICDEEKIEKAVNAIEVAVRERGYNQLKMGTADIEYNSTTNTSSIYISGVLGQRIKYEIIDVKKRFLIDDLFSDEELTNVDPTIVGPDAMAAELERRYRNKGFLDVTVTGPKVKKTQSDEFTYVYEVDPGIRYILSSVQFEGVTVFTEEELLSVLGLTSIWQSSRPLNLEEVKEGIETLTALYQSKGYWDVKVRDPGRGSVDRETGTVRMTIRVDEGRPRLLSFIEINGNKSMSNGQISELLAAKPGQPLDKTMLVDFQQKIRTSYITKGFLYAEISISLKPFNARKAIPTRVIVTIKEGVRVKIGDITIRGLIKTKPKVVKRELLFDSGEWYNPEKIADSRRALTRIGLFRSVQIIPADRNAVTRKESELDIIVEVSEGKAGNISFGPGWDLTKGWLYNSEASYNNIAGVNRQLSLRGSFSEERQQNAIGPKTLVGRKLAAGLIEPYVFNWPVDASLTVGHKAVANVDFWLLQYKGEIAFTHRFRNALLENSSVTGFYGQAIAKTEGSPEKEADLVASDVRIGQVGIRFNKDSRNNRQFPTEGFYFETEHAWARYGLAGNLRYYRWSVENNHYFPITESTVFALGMSATSYEGIERKGNVLNILPLSERLSLGGVDSVRGFKPGELGPLVRSPTTETYQLGEDEFIDAWDCGYATSKLGGTRRTLLKTELRQKLTDIVSTAGFIDSGNVFFSKQQMKKFQDAYLDPAAQSPNDPDFSCAGQVAYRSVEENVGYEYRDLAKKPGYLISRHYLTYGASVALLSPLGSVNIAYGLPWQEPKSAKCKEDDQFCYPRGRQSGYWLFRGELHIHVGAKF